jgi:ketosteroid isomerase-like protein
MKLKVFIFVLLCSSVSVFAQSKDDIALKSLIKQLTNAQSNYQPDVLDKILTADYIEISPVGEFDPREKVLGFYKPELKPSADKMSATLEVDEYSIRNYGKFAVVITRLTYKITSDGKTLPPRSIRATFICQKEKNVWKISSSQYTGIRPPQTPPKTD